MKHNRIRRDFQIAGVYIIRNITNGKCYIGSSDNIISRLNDHEKLLILGKHPNKDLQDDFNRKNHFAMDILEMKTVPRARGRANITHEERCAIFERERYYIIQYDSIENGYNRAAIKEDIFTRYSKNDPESV